MLAFFVKTIEGSFAKMRENRKDSTRGQRRGQGSETALKRSQRYSREDKGTRVKKKGCKKSLE
jgi:hypothetical protein